MSYEFTDFQRLVHAVPEGVSRGLFGGRGGGKSVSLAQDIAITANRYRENARILYLRQGPYKSLNDFIETLSAVFDGWWGTRAHSLNRSTWSWSNPVGSYIELGILPDGDLGRRYYEKTYQGRSTTHLIADEIQQWARPDNLDLMMSNLRGPIPTRVTLSGNPGGVGHQWIAQRYINGRENWSIFTDRREVRLGGRVISTTRPFVTCPSTYRDNPHNGSDYLANLAASCNHDLELLKAWISGSWKISRGAYFAAVLDNPHIEVTWPTPASWEGWSSEGWTWWLAHDHGSAAPSATYVMARSPGADGPDGLYYPADSLVLVDEYVTHRPGDFGKGFGWTVPQIAPGILELAKRWKISAQGNADDACFGKTGHQSGTIADEYGREGVVWRPARKGLRAPRMIRLKRLLAAAGDIEKAGLYVATRCRYWWQTVPFLVHDPDDPEVPLKCDTDHGLDATTYGLDGYLATSSFMRA